MPADEADGALEKANFDEIYVQPDPREYFRQLGNLDYEVPQYGKQVFRQVLDAYPADQPTVIDLCCSYGINGALLRCDLDLSDLYSRYTSPEVAAMSTAELLEADRAFYSERRRPDAPTIVGIDASKSAVEYGLDSGLLDAGVVEDLETNEPSGTLSDLLSDADVFTVTGGIGYITERTVDRLLDATPPERRPWFAALCLRTVPYRGIAEVLEKHGLVTERLADTTFPQRRFADEAEQEYALQALAEQGIDPSGKESTGWYHVNVYLSRPPEHASAQPIEELLARLG